MSVTKTQFGGTFAIAEMVLSVTVLIVLAGFTVHLFICGNTNNIKAHDLLQATSHAINIIETIKNLKHPRFLSDQIFNPETSLIPKENQIILKMYYDQNWVPIKTQDVKAHYLIETQTSPLTHPEADTDNAYKIQVRVLRLKPYIFENHRNIEITAMETYKYYAQNPYPKGTPR